MVEIARAAEESGWDGFFTWDGMNIGETPTYDGMSVLGAAAVVTSRITLGAMVFALARHRPWKFVRESITVDELSGGRLVIPVALGAEPDAGFTRIAGEAATRKERAQRLDETLAFITEAWKGESFSHHGTTYHTDDLIFRPTPVQQPRIPIWVVAAYPAPKSVARALKYDGILPNIAAHPFDALSPDEVAQVAATVRTDRTDDSPYEIVIEGRTEHTDADIDRVAALGAAGATWWIEARWDIERDNGATLLERVRQGPPRR
jgi:alkanesulfonate monooxygenase SsuD/methylene tetrahydromethanopterin reductase-like flavin-dependent oxidoreductase (luciferase family)